MRKIASAILAIAVLAVTGFAQTKTYEVKKGDTIGGIAHRYGVSTQDIVRTNNLSNPHKLKLGQKLRIPSKSSAKISKTTSAKSSGGYAIRNGDNDWSIARRYGISVKQLHAMNPGVKWTGLQIGQRLNVPGASVSKSTARPTLAAASVKAGGTYKVQKNDNDWIIAKRFGIATSKLHALNPGVKWSRLQIGQTIKVPGKSSSVKSGASLASAPIRSRYAVISKDNVVIRRGASTKTSKVATVSAGTQIKLLDNQNGWYKAQFPRGTVAWVRADMIKAVKASSAAVASKSSRNSRSTSSSKKYAYLGSASGNSAVNRALGMLGTRYVYGASSRSATDCSGFVLQVYRSLGVKLPRTSREMANVGRPVPKGSLQEGDLVFFRTRGSRISHVGIYKGNGQFVHASSGKGHVTISSLNEGYYQRRYAGARRVSSGKAVSTSRIASKTVEKKNETVVAAKTDEKPAAATVGETTTTKNTDEIVP
jgi:cell wall-associated NlpC family hydrolase